MRRRDRGDKQACWLTGGVIRLLDKPILLCRYIHVGTYMGDFLMVLTADQSDEMLQFLVGVLTAEF